MDLEQISASRKAHSGFDASSSPSTWSPLTVLSSTPSSSSSSSSIPSSTSTTSVAKKRRDILENINKQEVSSDEINKLDSFPITIVTPELKNLNLGDIKKSNMAKSSSSSDSSYDGDNCHKLPPLNKMVYLDEFEEVAKNKLETKIYDYYGQGADGEKTLRWNRTMILDKYCLKPRIMCDVSKVNLTRYIFGDKLSLPIGVSPTAMQKMANSSGEIGMVRACNKMNSLMILSFFSTTSLEDVAKAAPICTKWQNIYLVKNRDITQNLINRAIRYGYRALVVTCDAPILGNRRRDVKNGFTLGEFSLENIEDRSVKLMREHSSELFDPSLTWQDLADLKKSVGDTIRVIAKGIMTPEDAELAIKAGVDGIFISNHGGRQLDGAQATIEVLPSIVKVVNKRCPVFVDGGFRTGAEILIALALGADMVFVGRPPLWGLASYGEEGAYAVLRILQDELKRAMMLCGCSKLSDINKSIVIERK